MYRSIKSNQRKVRELYFRIDGSVPSLTIGNGEGTLVENSSGNYTITFTRPFKRILNGQVTVNTDVSTVRIVSLSTTAINVEQVGADATTPLADGDLYLTVTGSDTDEEYSEQIN